MAGNKNKNNNTKGTTTVEKKDILNNSSGEGFFYDIVYSIFHPGVNKSVVSFTRLSFVGLFGSLVFLGLSWEFNVHVIFMLTMTVVLFFMLSW